MTSTIVATIPFNDLEKMASAIAKSGLFGVKDSTQALALMLTAQAEGVHPATIAQDYDIIKGKASRKTQSVLARFQAAGGTVKWEKLTDTEAIGTFSHPAGGSVTIDWSIERAKKTFVYEEGKLIPLADRQMYKSGYPRAMLRSRCISEGVRAVYPAAIGGMLTETEALDAEDPPEKDMGKAVVVEQPELETNLANGGGERAPEEKKSQTPTLDDCKRLLNSRGKDAIPTVLDWKKHLLPADQVELDKLIEPIQKATQPKLMQEGQQRILAAKLKRSSLTKDAIEAKFGRWDDLKEQQFNEIVSDLEKNPL